MLRWQIRMNKFNQQKSKYNKVECGPLDKILFVETCFFRDLSAIRLSELKLEKRQQLPTIIMPDVLKYVAPIQLKIT